jgi:hypothetical protein
MPVDGADPVRQAAEPTAGARLCAADSVIGHLQAQQVILCAHLHRGVAGPAVLGDVGEELRGTEVGDGLDRLGRPARDIDVQDRGNGAAGDEGGQGRVEADIERRRVDPPGDLTQLGQGLLGLTVRGIDHRERAGRVEGNL